MTVEAALLEDLPEWYKWKGQTELQKVSVCLRTWRLLPVQMVRPRKRLDQTRLPGRTLKVVEGSQLDAAMTMRWDVCSWPCFVGDLGMNL